MDGAPTKNNQAGGAYYSRTELLDPDSVQEVRVETSNANAQYATPGTAVLTTKSGTNQFHGTPFETSRNNAFGVARSRADAVGFKAPQLIQNEFGISAGGPVIIPKLYDGRNKTFWFFAYERYSLAEKSADLIAIPTMAMRQGNFSGLVTSSGVEDILYDPSTTTNSADCPATGTANPYCRTAYLGNQIPLSEESPLAKVYYDVLPQPTTADDPLVKSNYAGLSRTYETLPQETFRLDQSFLENNKVYLRYTHQHSPNGLNNTPENVAADGIPAGAAFGYSAGPTEQFGAAIGYTHIFSPTFFSETIYSQQWLNAIGEQGADPDTDYESLLGLPNNFGEVGMPSITGLIKDWTASMTGNSRDSQINSLLDENLTKVIGHHQILFGGRLDHTRQSDQPNGLADTSSFGSNPTGLYETTSGSNYTAVTNTGYPDASFFLGSAGSYVVNHQAPRANGHQWGGALYAQDNYKVRDNLVLNLGLRYEAHPAFSTNNGLQNSFDFKTGAMVTAATPDQLIAKNFTTQAIITNDELIGMKFETPQEAGMPSGTLLNSYDWNFLPRLGAAWKISKGKWGPILRGGYGIYLYDTPFEDLINHPENNNPFTATYTMSYSSAAQAIDGLQNELIRFKDQSVFPVAGANSSNAVNTNSTNSILPGVALWSDDPNWKPAHVQEANVTVEEQMPWHSALQVSWVFSKSTDLDVSEAYNNPLTTFQWEAQTGTAVPTGGASVIGTPQQNTYSATALGPYNNTTYGGSTWHTKAGWANYNALQLNYQRLYHNGSAWQVVYVFAKAMTAGGDAGGGNTGDSTVDPDADYPGVTGSAGTITYPNGPAYAGTAPPPRPANLADWQTWHDMIKFQLYQLNTGLPVHHVKFNGIYDLPIGRGKAFFTNAPRWVNEIIGGFQVAGNGDLVSQLFQPGTGNYGVPTAVHIYKKRYPVTNCSSGVCYKEYL